MIIEMLRKVFETTPDASEIVLKGKCSDCVRETTIIITPTSGGFGLQGGTLIEYSSNKYLIKCHNCLLVNPNKPDNDKLQRRNFQFLKISDLFR